MTHRKVPFRRTIVIVTFLACPPANTLFECAATSFLLRTLRTGDPDVGCTSPALVPAVLPNLSLLPNLRCDLLNVVRSCTFLSLCLAVAQVRTSLHLVRVLCNMVSNHPLQNPSSRSQAIFSIIAITCPSKEPVPSSLATTPDFFWNFFYTSSQVFQFSCSFC